MQITVHSILCNKASITRNTLNLLPLQEENCNIGLGSPSLSSNSEMFIWGYFKIVALPKASSLQLEFEAKKMQISNEGLWSYFCLGSRAGESRIPSRKPPLRFSSLVWLTWRAAKFWTSEFQLSTPNMNLMEQDYQELSSESDMQPSIWNLLFQRQSDIKEN